MGRIARLIVVAAATATLAGTACSQVVSAPRWAAQGTFDYQVDDGGPIWGGGGPVTASISADPTIDLPPWANALGSECYDFIPFYGRECSRSYSGTLTTQAGFTGDPGAWTVRLRTTRYCDTLGAGCDAPPHPPLQIHLDELRNPEGTDGLYDQQLGAIHGTLIDGTDGCDAAGVKIEGTGVLASDHSAEVEVFIVICSPGLAAHMGATKSPAS